MPPGPIAINLMVKSGRTLFKLNFSNFSFQIFNFKSKGCSQDTLFEIGEEKFEI